MRIEKLINNNLRTENVLSSVKSTVGKTASVFGNVIGTASAFTAQKPANKVVIYSAIAAKVSVCIFLVPAGPAAIILKPVLKNVASRVVTIAGNTLSHFVVSVFTEKTFMEGMRKSMERSSTPFSVQVLGGVFGEAVWYAVKEVALPFELGLIGELTGLEKTAFKAIMITPVKQIGRFVFQNGYNLITSSEKSSWNHISLTDYVIDIVGDLNGKIFNDYARDELELDNLAQAIFVIAGVLIGTQTTAYALGKANKMTDYIPKQVQESVFGNAKAPAIEGS